MSTLAKAYEPAEVENHWYQRWLDADCFRGTADPAKEPFCITIPPPNVTGVLHMGHILNNTIQDIYTRRARQLGKAAVWVPGTDHAGIATQSRVERKLREEGKTRHDLGREKFVEVASQWRDEHRNIILDQLKKLGASCDWDRTVHTLDPDYSRAVLAAFVQLFHRGNIYRGKRMVNWCPVSLTALSDEEVIMKPQRGQLYKMRYEIVERPGEFVEISTTRPETLMGDTAVAIHPEDERYRHLHGCHVWRPFPREQIPFVTDTHVDREFGTGVLKVTPAHDRADWDIGQRHQLPVIDILTPDGKINCPACPDLHGKDRFEARKLAARKLEELGLLVATEAYENNVGFSERADVPIEPRLSDQWWLKYPKIEEAKACVADGRIKFYPERWSKTYQHWLENIQDWCISRQLWWGHRIPVWYRKGIDRSTLTEDDLRDPAKVHVSLDGPADPENWVQEDDVLDTWASSWLWPFGVFGWTGDEGTPNPALQTQRSELQFWYPTSLLATGFDIIFFWVARMIMAGLEFMGEVPFKAVYFNGLIRDAQGRKMSKSLGNSPDPLDLIAKFGADGLRLGLLLIAPKGQDIHFSEDRIQQGRNFCNKLWNAARFRLMQDDNRNRSDILQQAYPQSSNVKPNDKGSVELILTRIQPDFLDDHDHAMLERLCEVASNYSEALDSYDIHAATSELYTLFWNDFCDWYVEVSKSKLNIPLDPEHAHDQLDAIAEANNCLAIQDLCLRQILLMLHPLVPFITEDLFHELGFLSEHKFIQNVPAETGEEIKKILGAKGIALNTNALASFKALQSIVSQARALKAQNGLASQKNVSLYVELENKEFRDALVRNRDILTRMIGAKLDTIPRDKLEEMKTFIPTVTPLGTLYLDLAGSVDTAAEKARLGKELQQLEKAIAGAEAKLANERFTDKAPADVIQGVRQTLATNLEKQAEIQRLLQALD